MATVTLQGTTFTLSLQEKPKRWDGYTVNVNLSVKNEFIQYQRECRCNFADVETMLFGIFRLLAGGFRREFSLRLEGADAIVDFNPDIESGVTELTRTYLRSRNCKAVFSVLFYSATEKNTLGGVYTIIIPKNALKLFVSALQEEYMPYAEELSKRKGKYMLVGVSPQGYKGCNYWYLDEHKKTKPKTFVWVKMGRGNTLQLVYVDSVRCYNEDEAPYDISLLKRVEKQATKEDEEEAKKIWKE